MGMTAAHEVLFGGEGPRWFSIPAHRPFLDDLAFALDAALARRGPDALADALVLTPTRRSGRELAQAFVRAASGRAVLLPTIRAIGDLDEGEPPFEPGELALELPAGVTPLRRRFELARLVLAHAHLFERRLDAAGALELGDALAAFLDAVQIEEVDDPDRVAGLVEGDLARHWLRSAEFLRIATWAWPERLAELGLIDVAARRTRLLRTLAEQWRDRPPERPVIIAGVTNAAPSMAEVLRVTALAPQGAVVLPGLDLDLADTAWARVDEGHPQFALRALLAHARVPRQAVRAWPTPEAAAAQLRARDRRRLVNEALRPAETTDDWRASLIRMRQEGASAGVDPIAAGLQGLSVARTRTEGEAAATCAVLLREVLETPGRTAALVTPDPALARRVSAELARWGVEVDSSAGAPLAGLPAGVLAGLAAEALAVSLAPVMLLAVLKHPLVRLGLSPARLERGRLELERRGLRGPRAASWEALLARLQPLQRRLDRGGEAAARELERAAAARDLAERLRAALDIAAAPFAGEGDATAVEAARALAACLEALAADGRGRSGDLWAGPGGEAAAELLAGLMQDGAALPACTREGFAQLIASLLSGHVVRAGGRAHPRLRILGLIEARLIGADRLVLAGLEEGVWPAGATVDPFLSRPMRARLGLPSPERRVGVAAHDFAQAACAGEVVLVTSERRGGQPAVPSRWLWRLQTLARGAGLALPERDDAVRWARQLDAPLADPPAALRTALRPAPRPPVAARPTRLSVTEVEKLVRDPYAIYVRRILELSPEPRPDERIEARARGVAIHSAFEALAREWPTLDPADVGARFAGLYMEALRREAAPEALLAREAVLATRAGAWVAATEAARRAAAREVRVEQRGEMEVDGLLLTCRADRLEIADGAVHVLDFKTGRAPTRKEVETDFAPQLTLTAALLARGGFAEIGPATPGELVYLRVSGRDPAGAVEVRASAAESAAMADGALAGLQALLARYREADYPYRSRIAPRFLTEHMSDTDHLARVREWSAADEGEDE
jgi:ATP-dependent helicase/nuclease subunit B